MEAWAHADEEGHVWREERAFSAPQFQQYLDWYVRRTRVFLVRRPEVQEIPQPAVAGDTYSLVGAEERHRAVSFTIWTSHLLFIDL